MKYRYPIISFLGHVDHGKTSLIKSLCNINIDEKGDITQYIKIYEVKINNNIFVFIDTPGHESFIKLRNKIFYITDIIILVISGLNDINNKIIELIEFIEIYKIPFIIVINKIDKNCLYIDNIKNTFSKYKFISDNLKDNIVYTSAITKLGINELIDKIFSISKNINLSIEHNTKKVSIIEFYINNKKGISILIISKNTILKIGDFIVCGYKYFKIKFIHNIYNKNVYNTIQSLPFYIYGIESIPNYDIKYLIKVNNIKEAKLLSSKNKIIYDSINDKNIYFNKSKSNLLNFIIKVDTIGSFYAIKDCLDKNFINKYNINILKIDIGNINLNDITLSKCTNSNILGFNINININNTNLLKKYNIFFKNFFVIYDILNFIKKYINDKDNKFNDIIVDNNTLIKVINIFKSNKNYTIIGCKIYKGSLNINDNIKIIRNNNIIYNGIIKSLRIFKKNIDNIKSENEFGLMIKGKFDIKINDNIIKK